MPALRKGILAAVGTRRWQKMSDFNGTVKASPNGGPSKTGETSQNPQNAPDHQDKTFRQRLDERVSADLRRTFLPPAPR